MGTVSSNQKDEKFQGNTYIQGVKCVEGVRDRVRDFEEVLEHLSKDSLEDFDTHLGIREENDCSFSSTLVHVQPQHNRAVNELSQTGVGTLQQPWIPEAREKMIRPPASTRLWSESCRKHAPHRAQ